MNARAKSLFIAVYPVVVLLISIDALHQLASGDSTWVWVGALLTSLPMTLFFATVLLLRRTARTHPDLPVITGLAVAGGLLAVFDLLVGAVSGEEIRGLCLTLLGLVGFLAYDFWYSRLDREPSPDLEVGKPLPEFELRGGAGNDVKSAAFRGRPALFLFYRGNWCPLCMAQIREVAAKYRELAEAGVQVVLVSPQPESNTRDLADTFRVPFVFCSDPGNRAARLLGIAAPGGLPAGLELLGYDSETVLPTVIATDAGGRILFCDQTDNYRVRPEPETFIAVFREAGMTG